MAHRLRSLPLIAPAAAAFVLLASSPAAEAKSTICKNTYGGDLIRAKDVKCKKARPVVRAWAEGFKADGQPSREALGYRCTGKDDPYEGLIVNCVRSGKRITFYANVP
jgi:hypothetical protein